MRVLLQDRQTAAFLDSNHQRTPSRDRALLFKSSSDAVEYCAQYSLIEYDIILDFGNPSLDVRIPVTGAPDAS